MIYCIACTIKIYFEVKPLTNLQGEFRHIVQQIKNDKEIWMMTLWNIMIYASK
jgi:hypothetical protein